MSVADPLLPLDALKRAIAAFIRELYPTLNYMGFYTYAVVAFDESAQTADLQPENIAIGLPALPAIPIRLPGIKFKLKTGTMLLVGFENHDPARPYVAFFDKVASAAFLPDNTEIDCTQAMKLGNSATNVQIAGGLLTAARTTDPVLAGPWAGTITAGSSKVTIG